MPAEIGSTPVQAPVPTPPYALNHDSSNSFPCSTSLAASPAPVYAQALVMVPKRPTKRRIAAILNTRPTTSDRWLREIAAAYLDAAETIPLGPVLDLDLEEGDLFHLAPAVCLKFRKIKASKGAIKRATDAALTSYVATTGRIHERSRSRTWPSHSAISPRTSASGCCEKSKWPS